MSKLYRENFPPHAAVVTAFNLGNRHLVDVTVCRICGCAEYEVVSKRDRHGFELPFHMCLRCGMVYIAKRLSDADYAKFYKDDYYKLVSAYWEQCFGPRRKRKEQRKYADRFVPFIVPYLKARKYSIIDVGGGVGVIAANLNGELVKKGKVVDCTILDPSPDAVSQAKTLDMVAIKGLAEHHKFATNQYDLVLMCRSIDHLIDPVGTIKRIRASLTRKGVFFCDYVDLAFTLIKRQIPRALHLDHLFNFTEKPFLTMMARCGLEPCSKQFVDKSEKGYLFRKCPPKDVEWDAGHPEWLRGRLKKFTREEAGV